MITAKKIFIFLVLISFPIFTEAQLLRVPGVTPDSIYYPLDILGEKIVLFFTFSTEKKIEKALNYAEEKLAEIKAMAEKGKSQFVEKAIQNYQRYLNLANTKNQELKEVEQKQGKAALIARSILNYQKNLVMIYQESTAPVQLLIKQVIEVSQKEFEKAINILPEKEKEELNAKATEITFELEEPIEKEVTEDKESKIEESPEETEAETLSFTPEEKSYLAECKAIEFSDIFEIVKCYKELGRKFKNLNLCAQTEEISGLGSCYGGVSATTGDLTLCNQFKAIPSEGAFTILTSTCFGSLAQIKRNPQICETVPTFKSRVGCYLLMAGLEKDVAICDNITQGREGCYIIVADEKEDRSICNKIANLNWKNLCFLTVESEISGKTELCKIGEALGLFTEKDCLEQLLGK